MDQIVKTFSKCMLAGGVLFMSAFAATAQTQPGFQLNQEEINLKTGVPLSALKQQEEVFLSLTEQGDAQPYDSLIVYLARGNRPLIKQTTNLTEHKSMEISQVLKSAREGDRLVLELVSNKRKEPYVSTVVFH